MITFSFFFIFLFLFSDSSANQCNIDYLKKDSLAKFLTCKTDQRLDHLKNYSSVRDWSESNVCKLCLEKLNLTNIPKERINKRKNTEIDEVKKEVVFQQKPLPSLKNNQPIGYNLAPPDQKFLNNLISSTNKKVSQAVNSAKAKYLWIQANKKLCSSNEFNAYEPKKDWVGVVKNVLASDNGDISIRIHINDFGNQVRDLDLDGKLIDKVLNFKPSGRWDLDKKKATFVKFSGSFEPGKISENECLDGSILDAEPKLTKIKFYFKISEIEELK
jgi:hypothetical protein